MSFVFRSSNEYEQIVIEFLKKQSNKPFPFNSLQIGELVNRAISADQNYKEGIGTRQGYINKWLGYKYRDICRKQYNTDKSINAFTKQLTLGPEKTGLSEEMYRNRLRYSKQLIDYTQPYDNLLFEELISQIKEILSSKEFDYFMDYANGYNFAEIGRQRGLSRQYCRQMIYNSIGKLQCLKKI